MQSIPRRAVLRHLGILTTAAALGGRAILLHGQATPAPDPFADDITVFFIGPWLFFAKAPDRPGMMLALTCDDPMHSYRHGLYRGVRPMTPLPARDYSVGVTHPVARPGVSANLFGPLNADLLCLDASCDCIGLTTPAPAGLRKVYLPTPDSIIAANFISRSAASPLFVWPGKPASQVLPMRAATTLVLRYRNAAGLTVDNGLRARRGDHVHFEIVVPTRPATPQAEQAHTIAFSTKLSQSLTYAGTSPEITFHPGLSPAVDPGATGLNPAEVGGMNTSIGFNRSKSFAHLSLASFVRTSTMNFETVDCSGAMMAVGL